MIAAPAGARRAGRRGSPSTGVSLAARHANRPANPSSNSSYITAMVSYTSTLPPAARTGQSLASPLAAARLSALSTE
jgi:hypothetical protein